MGGKHPEEMAIFTRASEIKSPEERKAYLDNACGGNATLREALEDLLRRHEAEDSFLQSPVLAAADTVHLAAISEKPGDTIGRYKLLEQIGEGGFGVVYMAEQVEPIRRRVALKIIKLGLDTKAVIARFEAERQALALMEHPNIARVLDAGATETGRPYFVMELVRGVPITDYCDRGNLNTQDRLGLFTQVCSAVQHAHQKGIIHRDLKPTNILITLHDGVPVPKIIDFGIAKAMDRPLADRTFFTAFHEFVGTPQYMSPEQAEMSGLAVDTRSDIYSLGVLLYELLTGTTPFEAEALRSAAYDEICRIIREVDPPPPSTRISAMGERATEVARHRDTEPAMLGKLVQGDLDWIVMKTLEKDRTRRYETAAGLAEDIQRHLNDEPVMASPPSAGYRLRKFVRRNRVQVIAGLLVVVSLLVGLGIASFAMVQAFRQRGRALAAYQEEEGERERRQQAEQKAEQERLEVAAAERRAEVERSAKDAEAAAGREVQRWQLLIQAHSLAESRCYPQALQILKNAVSIKHDQATHLALWRLASLYSDRPLMTLRGHDTGVGTVAISPDGRTLASGDWRGAVKLWDVATGREQHSLSGHTGVVSCVVFGPDGKVLASGGHDKTVRLWDVATGRELRTLSGHTDMVSSVAFSPSGTILASAGSGEKPIRLWDLQTGEELRAFGDKDRACSVAFSPDGRALASQNDAGAIRLWDVATGQELQSLETPGGEISEPSFEPAVAFSPDGQMLASTDLRTTIDVWDLPTGKVLRMLYGHGGAPRHVAFSPDGRRLGSAAWDEAKLWDVARGKEVHTFGDGAARCVAFTPDGKTLATGTTDDHTIKLWDVNVARALKERLVPGHWVRSLAVSPDGKTLASGSADETVKLWDAATGQELRTLSGHAGPVWGVAFSADGRILASGSTDTTVKLWEVATGRELRALSGHADSVKCLAFSPASSLLASGSDDRTIRLWDVATGKELRTLNKGTDSVWCIAFSPDGRKVAWGAGRSLRLWDVVTGRQQWGGWRHKGTVRTVAFSPDGKTLASGGHDRLIKLWEVATGKQLLTLGGHADVVTCVSFSPDGHVLASGSRDGTLRLWDAATGSELVTLGPLRAWAPPIPGFRDVYTLAFSPDGRTLTCSVGEEILTYDFHAHDEKIARWLWEAVYSPGQPGATWEALRRNYPDDFTVSQEEVLAWESEECDRLYSASCRAGNSLTQQGQWEKAVDCYSQAINLEPDRAEAHMRRGDVFYLHLREYKKGLADYSAAIDVEPESWEGWYLRGCVYAESGHFQQAAPDFAEAAERQPGNPHLGYCYALTRLATGDTEGYRQGCADMLASFGGTEDPGVAHWLAWTSVLGPDALDVWGQIGRAAELALRSDEKSDRYMAVLGAVLYREGRWDDAIERLGALCARWDSGKQMPTIDSPAYTWFFLAMAHRQRGHLEESRRWLDRAVERAGQELRDSPPWNRRLTLRILQREAESVVRSSGGNSQEEKEATGQDE